MKAIEFIKNRVKEHLPGTVRRRIRRLRSRGKVDEVDLLYAHVWKGCSGMMMFDVGAHHGESFEDFALQGWRIHAFEPDPVNRAILQRRAAEFAAVKVDSRAVGAQPRESVPFFRSDLSTGISSLSAFHSTHQGGSTVDVTTLRDVVAEEEIKSVQLLKIDTEGHDLMVLRGFPWDELKPESIICEFEDRKTQPLGYTFADLADFLAGLGYHVLVSEWFPIKEYGQAHQWRSFARYPCELADEEAWGNLIAVLDEHVFDKLCTELERS